MLAQEQKIDKTEKIKLLLFTLALATFVVLVANVFFLLLHISQNISSPLFQTIIISYDGNYLRVNHDKVGFALLYNLLGILLLWILMTFHTLKTIRKPFMSVFL